MYITLDDQLTPNQIADLVTEAESGTIFLLKGDDDRIRAVIQDTITAEGYNSTLVEDINAGTNLYTTTGPSHMIKL